MRDTHLLSLWCMLQHHFMQWIPVRSPAHQKQYFIFVIIIEAFISDNRFSWIQLKMLIKSVWITSESLFKACISHSMKSASVIRTLHHLRQISLGHQEALVRSVTLQSVLWCFDGALMLWWCFDALMVLWWCCWSALALAIFPNSTVSQLFNALAV